MQRNSNVMKSIGTFCLTLLPVALGIISSCNSTLESQGLANSSQNLNLQVPVNKTNANQVGGNSINSLEAPVSYKGVTFINKIPGLHEVKGLEVQAVALEDESDRPDGVAPRHISIEFDGEFAQRHLSSSKKPTISIYPIAEYESVFAISRPSIESNKREFQRLADFLSRNPVSVRAEDMPFILFVNGAQQFIAKLEYFPFKDGKGVGYVTQFNPEVRLINNEQLTYVFQGLTNDGKYYVLGTFPIRAAFLPDKQTASHYRDYEIPDRYYEARRLAENTKRFKQYLAMITAELESAPATQFEPNIDLIKDSLTTIAIDSNLFGESAKPSP